ncbi:ribonuclease H-like protein [Penicillium pulvis]|uniref:ribonuclease H-like protein n=1 Tax=Penicillium pulvis TaxID=1562058 RepID=UPI002549A01E|nr:ribonuclease H-like protein [Penicillium pulvis]KAJ5785409.1 ribonuclease H-like protein [Penicillium pulvis]
MRPSKYSVPSYQFRATPARVESLMKRKRHAIALRCEMVGVSNDRLALAFIGAIDFLTGDVLINKYVRPVEKVVDWRSEVTGVTRLIMNRAIDDDEIFEGWQEARQILWEFIDDDTVIVGHSLNFDLEALGICHTKVVDSAIVAAEAVSQPVSPATSINRMWDLKALVKGFLTMDIEVGKSRHGALEGAYSARDVVIWCIRNPEQLKMWAEDARAEMEKQKPGDVSTDMVPEENP